MKCVFYSSTAVKEFYSYELAQLALESAFRNQSINITGYLFYKSEIFYQYIEGEVGFIDTLMEKIHRDKRHKILNSIFEVQETQRRFPYCWMSVGWPVQSECNYFENALIQKLSMRDLYNSTDPNYDNDIWFLVDKLAYHYLKREPIPQENQLLA